MNKIKSMIATITEGRVQRLNKYEQKNSVQFVYSFKGKMNKIEHNIQCSVLLVKLNIEQQLKNMNYEE